MFADTPEPPYLAVIFTAQRSAQDAGYAATASRMEELVREQPGFLGFESAHNANGDGITVSYWRDEAAARAWREQAEHAMARARGNVQWYDGWQLRVARVERAESFQRAR